jgi:hypothetical protein
MHALSGAADTHVHMSAYSVSNSFFENGEDFASNAY